MRVRRLQQLKEAGEDHKKLREIARKLLDKAAQGDMQAINCLADRLDGKPAQAVEVSAEPTSYVIRLPEPCSNEEWEANVRAGKYGVAAQRAVAKKNTGTGEEHVGVTPVPLPARS